MAAVRRIMPRPAPPNLGRGLRPRRGLRCNMRLKPAWCLLALSLSWQAAAEDACFPAAEIVDWMALDTRHVFVWVSEKRRAYEVELAQPCPRLRRARQVSFAPDPGGQVCGQAGHSLQVAGDSCPVASVKAIRD